MNRPQDGGPKAAEVPAKDWHLIPVIEIRFIARHPVFHDVGVFRWPGVALRAPTRHAAGFGRSQDWLADLAQVRAAG